jgi:hypothetical protein
VCENLRTGTAWAMRREMSRTSSSSERSASILGRPLKVEGALALGMAEGETGERGLKLRANRAHPSSLLVLRHLSAGDFRWGLVGGCHSSFISHQGKVWGTRDVAPDRATATPLGPLSFESLVCRAAHLPETRHRTERAPAPSFSCRLPARHDRTSRR